jgi:hypothetical protein
VRRASSAFFLGDVAFVADPKFRALARRLTEPDDFNSAVGAYWIALAAARRNGLPTIDVAAETSSRFLDDLVAVGLLETTGLPETPFRAWAPARPKYPSDLRPAPSAPYATSSPSSPQHSVPSSPLLSSPRGSTGGAGGEKEASPEVARAALEEIRAGLQARGALPRSKVKP